MTTDIFYRDSDLARHPQRRPPASRSPLGNSTFELMRLNALAAAERKPQEPTEPPSAPAPAEASDDPRARRIRALEADVAALRCALARLEVTVSNLQRTKANAR